jgi:hypothetical protein
MEFEEPWNRETRHIAGDRSLWSAPKTRTNPSKEKENQAAVPAFEFAVQASGMPVSPSGSSVHCAGGGANAAFNLNSVMALEADVSGCKLLGLPQNVSGDELTYMAGPRFTYRGFGRLTPWLHVLLGGEKDSQEVLYPDRKETVLANPPAGMTPHELHALYTSETGGSGLGIAVGGGVDWALNRTLAFRLGDVDYVQPLSYRDPALRAPDLRVTMGVVFRVGD